MIARIFTVGLIAGAFVTLLGLGTWQMQRLAWKEGLIAQAQERPQMAAVPLDDVVEEFGLRPQSSYPEDAQTATTDALAYRRVTLEGFFFGDPVRVFTTLSDPRGPLEGPGYWLMQGFQTTRNVLFVNRGFIPFELPADVAVRQAPVGTVRFEGLVRPDDRAGLFTPDPDFDEQLIYRRSVSQLQQATGVSVALPITVDMPASALPGLPQAGETKFSFSNRHFEYMLTWYGLAIVLMGVVGVAWWRRRFS